MRPEKQQKIGENRKTGGSREVPKNESEHAETRRGERQDRNWANDTIDLNNTRDRRLTYLCSGDNNENDEDEGDDFRWSRMLLANEFPD